MSRRGGSEDKRIVKGANITKRRRRMYISNPHCNHCNRLTSHPHGYQIDHIVALSNGGTDTDDNLQLLCHECHEVKTAQDLGYEYVKPVTIGVDGWPID